MKRFLALMMTAVLSVSLLPYELFADWQNPIKGISAQSFVKHTNEGDGEIRPDVNLMFEEPDPSGRRDERPYIKEPDRQARHDVYHYQVDIQEHTQNGRNFKWPSTPKLLSDLIGQGENPLEKGIKVGGLDNGRLYRMSIVPSHYHGYDDGEGDTNPRLAPSTGDHPYEYVLTDFDTRMEGVGGSLEISWEDSGHNAMGYQIGYIQGSYAGQTLDQINENSKGNNIQYITLEDAYNSAERYRDPQTGRWRFKYTIDNTVDSTLSLGQIYSAYVVSTTNRINNKPIFQNKETPKVVTATTEIGLSVYNAGKDTIRLEWDARIPDVLDGSYELQEAQIKEYRVGSANGRVITTLYGKEGADIGYYEYREPKESTYYQLVFKYKHKDTPQMLTPDPQTAKVLYVPGQLRTKPATPQIPKPIGPSTTVTAANRGEFLLPEDRLPHVPLIDLWKHDHTFHANMVNSPTLNFVWSTYKEDLSLLYDIWVTDDIGVTMLESEPIISDLSFSSGQNSEDVLYNQDREEVVGFKHTIREYYNSAMEKLPLVPNKVYYVKIVAKKAYGSELEPSLPAVVTIMFDSGGEVFAPPTISKPPLRLEPGSITSASITVGWLETWYEIMAKKPKTYPEDQQEKAKEWNSKVYTTGPSISFKPREDAKEHILKRQENINILKNLIGEEKYDDNYLDRLVSLGKNVKYEYKFMSYEEVRQGLQRHNETTNNKKTVDEYIEILMKSEDDPEQDYGWKEITPKTEEDEKYISWKLHTQANLKPNTSYVFFIKPYQNDYDGSKLQAALPTWIVGTTLPDGEMEEARPTVPTLSLHGKGDSHIDVEWKYNEAFDYEIRYSRLDDPDQATVWPFEISSEIGDERYVEDGGTAVVRIDGLFPDTSYNIWIRAKQKGGQEISAWSNPVTSKTDLLGAPTAPSGLGIASYQSILEVGRDFKPVDSKHITVEWERNGPDKDLDQANQDSNRVQKEFQYVIELADNPEFIDRQSVTVGADTVGTQMENREILSRSMVRFDDLIANRPYYVRAKTRLIAHDTENDRQIIMESDFTQLIRIITKPSQDEYDGGDKVNEVIYPNKIEESYDGTTWTYEIVDTQKVLNEMVRGNNFRYIVPVEKYRGRYDPKYRVIRIPQPIVRALINRRMELEIRTNILSIQIPAKALAASMEGADVGGMVEFIFETLDMDKLHETRMGYEFGFLSRPEKMSISLRGKSNVSIQKVDALMKLAINMPDHMDYSQKNLGGYTYDTIGGVWKKGNHEFDKINSRVVYTTGSIGTYAVYEKNRLPNTSWGMSQSMENVVQKHDIIGLGTIYQSNRQVSPSEYIQIMLGIAENRPQIEPGIGPTNAQRDRARRSGLYTGNPNTGLTQEAAISGLVKLYELTHGISVRPNTSNNVSGISASYQNNIQKAYTIGLIDYINPKQSITYGQLFNLIEQVIE